MGSNSVNETWWRVLAKKLQFLAEAAQTQVAVWSDFHFKTNYSKPFMILIEPTLRCPMKCKFCDLPLDTTYPKEIELSLDQWKRVLRELQDYSGLIRDVFISGGEPFLRPDMCDIIEYAHSLGLDTRTITIGAFCDKSVCDRLLKSPMRWLKFSIHSVRQHVHDQLVGGKVFEKSVSAIEYLRSEGYTGKIGILTTIWEGNVQELGDLARFAEWIGVDSVFYRPLFGNTKAIRLFSEPAHLHPECIVRDHSVVHSAIEELKELKRQGLPIANTEEQLDLIVKQVIDIGTNDGVKGCRMMYESIYIRPNGDVEVCGHMSLGTMGNVAERSLSDVLSSEEAYNIRHRVSRDCRCQGNAFVRKTFNEKISIVMDILRG